MRARVEREKRGEKLTEVVMGYFRDAADTLQSSVHVASVAHVEETTYTRHTYGSCWN